MINVESKIYLKVLSPVHIGGAQEKHLQEGLDYFDNWRINEKEVYHPERGINPDELAEALASGNRNALAILIKKQKDWKRYVIEIQGPRGTAGEIKAFIRSATDGKAYIPGSSIKGAIRSAIAHFLCGGISANDPDQTFIKTFENSLFRYFKICDSTTFPLATFQSKIATLVRKDSGLKLFWKNSGRDNVQHFNPDGFNTTFESPSINTLTQFQIKIGQAQFQQFKARLTGIHPLSATFLENEFIISHIFQSINKATNDFLTREINWFKTYPGDQSSMIVKRLTDLKTLISSGQFCLLHLGSGSGFHAMTGDWQFQDHSKTGEYAAGYHKGKPKYKTRRIAFNQWPNPSYFGPMGYVLLSLSPFHESENKSILVEKVDDIVKPPVEIKPVHRKVTIKNGVILDGVVKENKMVDVYLPDDSIKTVKLVSGVADVGKIIEVAIFPDGKGNFIQASFKGFKK